MLIEELRSKLKKLLSANEYQSVLNEIHTALSEDYTFNLSNKTEINAALDECWNFIAEIIEKISCDKDPILYKKCLELLFILSLKYREIKFHMSSKVGFLNIALLEESAADFLADQLDKIPDAKLKQHLNMIIDYYKSAIKHYLLSNLPENEKTQKAHDLNISILHVYSDLMKYYVKNKKIAEAFVIADDMNAHYCATFHKEYNDMTIKAKVLQTQYNECDKLQKKQFSEKELNLDPFVIKRNAVAMDYLVEAYSLLLPFSKSIPEVLAKAEYFVQCIKDSAQYHEFLRKINLMEEDAEMSVEEDCKATHEFDINNLGTNSKPPLSKCYDIDLLTGDDRVIIFSKKKSSNDSEYGKVEKGANKSLPPYIKPYLKP